MLDGRADDVSARGKPLSLERRAESAAPKVDRGVFGDGSSCPLLPLGRALGVEAVADELMRLARHLAGDAAQRRLGAEALDAVAERVELAEVTGQNGAHSEVAPVVGEA